MPRRSKRRLLATGQAGDASTAGARRVAGNLSLVLVGRVVNIVSGIITLPLLARSLGPDGFGAWSAALAYVGIFTSLTEFGLTNAGTQKMAGDPGNEAEWLSAVSTLRTAMAVGLGIVCAAGIPIAVAGEGDARVVAAILLVTLLTSGAGALMSVFQSRLRAAVPLALNMLQTAMWLTAVVLLAVVGTDPVLTAVVYGSILTVIALLQVVVTRKEVHIDWRGSTKRWRGLLRIAVPVGLAGLFVTIYYRLDALLLYRLADPAETGAYGAAYRFIDSLVLLPGSVMTAFLPIMAASVADPERLKRVVQRALEIMAVISLPVVVTTGVLAGPIVHLLFGDEFDRTATVLPILMIAFVAICYGNVAGFLAPVVGLQWRTTLYAAVGAAANVALNLALIPKHGAVGSAWATVVTESLTMSLMLATNLKRMHMRPALGRLAAIAAAAAIMGGAMLLLKPVGLLPALALGGIVYLAALLGLRGVLLDELRALRRPQDAAAAGAPPPGVEETP